MGVKNVLTWQVHILKMKISLAGQAIPPPSPLPPPVNTPLYNTQNLIEYDKGCCKMFILQLFFFEKYFF